MPLVLQLNAATNNPFDTTSTNGGTTNLAAVLTGSTIGEVFAPPISIADPSVELFRYKKVFVSNVSGDTTAWNAAKIYIKNGLADVASNGTGTIVSDNAGDTGPATFTGLDASSVPQQETITMAGLTPVSTSTTWSWLSRVQTNSSMIGTATVEVNSVNLGIIPPTYHSAEGEVAIVLAASQGDSATTTNTTTAPAGTFTKPNTSGTALAVPGTNVADASGIGVWYRLDLKANLQRSSDIEVVLAAYGN